MDTAASNRQQRLASRCQGRWAEVRAINRDAQRIAIINDWGYAIAEIREGDVQLHDVVEGCVEAVGPSTWLNLCTDRPVTVNITHVQETMVTAAMLLMRETR